VNNDNDLDDDTEDDADVYKGGGEIGVG